MLLRCAALLSRLPLCVHYAFADGLLFPIMYHLVRYRRQVVAKNLRNAFPEKSDRERKSIERAFYHQFCDTIVETIYGFRISAEEMKQRVVFENADEVDHAAKTAGGCVVMLAHVGCWEWMSSCQQWFSPEVLELNVYRKAKRESTDKALLEIRKKRGGAYVEKQRLLREMVRYRAEKQAIVLGLIADQKPRPEVTRTWVYFLHQETGFLDGGEELAKRFNYPVYALTVKCPQRGHYQCRFELLSNDPKATEQGAITAAYARNLEKNIIEQPELWLWSHNRFKWKRN
ncbi:MAG: lysophospholipid acyltransferase family protein [Paludibacteraceae bacterium]|nr:lysophospholipid acyltransferase family protein [Paludibacteraceae bacterium]